MKESVDWEVFWLEPGGKLNSKKVAGYNRARQEASNLKYKLRDTLGIRVWIMREF